MSRLDCRPENKKIRHLDFSMKMCLSTLRAVDEHVKLCRTLVESICINSLLIVFVTCNKRINTLIFSMKAGLFPL